MLSYFRISKLRLVWLTAVLSVFLFSLPAFAGEARINFSDPSVSAGSLVNISMKITSDDGTAISSADIVLSYPTEKLEFVSGTDADGGAGSVRVHGVSNGGGSSIVEYNLSFRTVSAGTASVTIASAEVYDADDNFVSITHLGSSSVSIEAGEEVSSDSGLKLLEVYPGELSPAFSSDNTEYTLTVGLGVERLTINADPTDASSSISIAGNDDLPDGDSIVTLTVTASDGVSITDYAIHVSKILGGPESVINDGTYASSAEGVQLSSKGKTITIMDPSDNVEIPEGLKEGVIKIDDQKVLGWVVDGDPSPEYCVVYGMNESGELNFYRYDLIEKSLQRYFADPLNENAVTKDEYNALLSEKDAAEAAGDFRLVIIFILAALAFIFLIAAIYLYTRLNSYHHRAHEQKAREMRVRRDIRAEAESDEEESPVAEDLDIDTGEIDKSTAEHDEIDETHIISRTGRRRPRRSVSQSVANEDLMMKSLDETDSPGTEPADTEPAVPAEDETRPNEQNE